MGQFLESLNDEEEEEIPTFVGIKFTSPNLQEGARALRANNNRFVVFLGNNEVQSNSIILLDHRIVSLSYRIVFVFQLMDAACAIGMNSFIITSLSMFPELTVSAFTAGKAGNLSKARETQQRLTDVLTSISKYGTLLSMTQRTSETNKLELLQELL